MTKEEWKTWFKWKHSNRLVFAYNQLDETKKTFKYHNSQGICTGMSTDWMRRKLFNEHLPDEKQKRNFNDPKYGWRYNRVRLTKKHGSLQSVYANHPLKSEQELVGKMAESMPGKGFESLRIYEGATKIEFTGDYSWRSYVDLLEEMDGRSGLKGTLWSNHPFHTIAVYKTAGGRMEIFDPNFGEYGFAMSAAASGFLFDLCDGYLQFADAADIRLRPAEWGDE